MSAFIIRSGWVVTDPPFHLFKMLSIDWNNDDGQTKSKEMLPENKVTTSNQRGKKQKKGTKQLLDKRNYSGITVEHTLNAE